MNQAANGISVVPLTGERVGEADAIFRLAFGTFLGMDDPTTFMSGRDTIRSRRETYADGALAALSGDTLIGSNISANWGSFAWFGPLTVHPAYWDRGVAKRLLATTVDVFDRWGTRNAALFTFADSPKHHGLYERFDFWPRYLTVLMNKAVTGTAVDPHVRRFSKLSDPHREECLAEVLSLGNELLEGLDVRREVSAVQRLRLGDSLFLWSDRRLEAFAVCHYGVGSEADPRTCYVKFAAVRPGKDAQRWFLRLLHACDALAAREQLSTLEAGMNLERSAAHRAMLREGFTVRLCGVQMFRGNDPAYNAENVFVIDDLR